MERFDVVIVGARCAGASLAIRLARQGLRVCLLDKASFPSETPSTHVVQPAGVRLLDELGVLAAVLRAGGVPLEQFTLVNDDVRMDATVGTGNRSGLCVRRSTMDVFLVEAAAAAGADVRPGVAVRGIGVTGGRVTGVRTDRDRIAAALVVGADGRNSTVARSVRAPEHHVVPPGRMPAWAYFEGVSDREPRLRLGRRGGLTYLAAPTDDGLYLAGTGVDFTDRARFLADRDAHLRSALRGWPELDGLLAGARRVGPIRVMTDWHGYFRPAAGPGWALVGDAGHFKDFTPAQGISDALRQAARLAEEIVGVVHDPGALDDALRTWAAWRDRDAWEMHWFAADLGAPGPSSPLITRLLRDIAADPGAVRTFLDVLDHRVAPSALLTWPRLAKAAVRALLDQPRAMRSTALEIATAGREELRRARLHPARSNAAAP